MSVKKSPKKSVAKRPAPIVKCPYCEWRGSARGIFTHVRLGHPQLGSFKPPHSIEFVIHPFEETHTLQERLLREIKAIQFDYMKAETNRNRVR